MARDLRNVGASVRARILERARAGQGDFQGLLTRYALERFLYRLSVSKHREHFVLKGAMLFVVWVADPFRPTRDLDLLGQGDSTIETVTARLRAICSQPVADDGVVFDDAGLVATPIREDMEYGGVRVRTTATISGAKLPIQIDIGFGDAITPGPLDIDYPVMRDSPVPHIKAYPAETVVAEKFEALVKLGMANTRLKDFYDLWLISRTFSFTASVLSGAIAATFERRGTPPVAGVPTGLADDFVVARATQWRAFLNRERMAAVPADLAVVLADLRVFLMPVTKTVATTDHNWHPGGPWQPLI